MSGCILNEKPVHPASRQLQIFDLKLLADMEDAYRCQTREFLRAYRRWKQIHKNQTDMLAVLYGGIEGIMLRRQAEEAVRFYWTLRRDFRRAYGVYMRQIQAASWRKKVA